MEITILYHIFWDKTVKNAKNLDKLSEKPCKIDFLKSENFPTFLETSTEKVCQRISKVFHEGNSYEFFQILGQVVNFWSSPR
jgi:hypothetical protein